MKKLIICAISMFMAIVFTVNHNTVKAKSTDSIIGGTIVEEDDGGNVAVNSTVTIYGPLKGAKQWGTPARCSYHRSIQNLNQAANFLAAVTGKPYSYFFAGSALALYYVQNNTQNQYYTRTLYYSSDETMYYYKYTFYRNSNYTGVIGTEYSFVYSMLY